MVLFLTVAFLPLSSITSIVPYSFDTAYSVFEAVRIFPVITTFSPPKVLTAAVFTSPDLSLSPDQSIASSGPSTVTLLFNILTLFSMFLIPIASPSVFWSLISLFDIVVFNAKLLIAQL